MMTQTPSPRDFETPTPDAAMAEVMRQIARALQSVRYGSVEVVIQNSTVVQIERKEKFRFDKPLKL